jgi:hypothetical protein
MSGSSNSATTEATNARYRQMKTSICKGLLGMVLEVNLTEHDPGQPPFSAHVIVNRLQLDDDGNICLSSCGGLQETLDQIDGIKSQLDQLASECVLELARSVAFGHPKLRLVSTSGGGEALNGSNGVTENTQATLLLELRSLSKRGA